MGESGDDAMAEMIKGTVLQICLIDEKSPNRDIFKIFFHLIGKVATHHEFFACDRAGHVGFLLGNKKINFATW